MQQNLRRSFRIVTTPKLQPLVCSLLKMQGFEFSQEPFCDLAFRLEKEPFPLGRSLAAFFGYIYIQDRSSMLPPLALAPSGGLVLDMCSSPGSKTGLLAQLVGRQGLVVANEPNSSRLANLRRNLLSMNLPQVVSCCYSGEKLGFPNAFFENILLDPPCSGWGTTDKNPLVMKMWKGDKVKPLVRLQQALLTEAARLLAPGGRIIYSTCTTNIEENEEQVRYARDELGLIPVALEPFSGFVYAPSLLEDVQGILRVDEEASDAQGFFVAAFTKYASGDDEITLTSPLHSPYFALSSEQVAQSGLSIDLFDYGQPCMFNNIVHMVPKQAANLPVRWQGLILGKMLGSDLRPHSCLRELMDHNSNLVPRVDLDDISDVQAVIQGQSLKTGLSGRLARLYWQNLPLGLAGLKSGRLIWGL